MPNVTFTIDENVLRKARIRALEQGTSVSAVVRAHLETYAGVSDERQQALEALLAPVRRGTRRRFHPPARRDELHER